MIRGLERMVTAGVYSPLGIEHWQKHVRQQLGARQRQQLELRRQELAAIYGPDHPYARTGIVTPDAADKVHLDAMNTFRRQHYSAGNATLVVVGDFDPAVVEREIRDSFAAWDRGTVDRPVDRTPLSRTGALAIGVVGSEAPQLHVIIGYPAPAGVDGQAAARAVLAQMLNLRVGDLRFKLGATYGVYARHTQATGPTAYELGGDVDAERGGESIKAMRDGVAMLRRGDHFDQDFVRARRKVLSDLLGESTITAELAARLGFIASHDLPPDYYRTLVQQVAAVSPAQIHALVAQELDPAREAIVVLGDRPHLERAFADAGLTGARIIDAAAR